MRLVLLDGDPEGLRSVSIAGRTTLVTGCPFTGLQALRKRDEAKRPAIYFLVGDDLQQQTEAIYIGECDFFEDRFSSSHHALEKADWRHVFIASTTDRTFNKAHARRAEHLLVQRALETKRAAVLTKQTSPGELDDGDTAFAQEFVKNAFILAEILGISIFRPLPVIKTAQSIDKNSSYPLSGPESQPAIFLFSYTGQVVPARLAVDGKDYVILKGSKALAEDKKGLPDNVRALREVARTTGVLIPDSDNPKLEIFTADYPMSSTSAAGSMIYGSSCAGPIAWRHEGTHASFKEWIGTGA